MFNKVFLVGRLTRDCSVSKTKSEMKDVCNFTVATQESKNAQVEYIDCTAWEHNAKYIGQYGRKGMLVLVSGKLHKKKYIRNDQTFYETVVEVKEFKILEKKEKNAQPTYQSEMMTSVSQAVMDDEQYVDPNDLDLLDMPY